MNSLTKKFLMIQAIFFAGIFAVTALEWQLLKDYKKLLSQTTAAHYTSTSVLSDLFALYSERARLLSQPRSEQMDKEFFKSLFYLESEVTKLLDTFESELDGFSAEVKPDFTQDSPERGELLQKAMNGDRVAAEKILNQWYDDHDSRFQKLDRFFASLGSQQLQNLDRISDLSKRATQYATFFLIFAAALAIMSYFYFSRNLLKPLKKLTQSLKKTAVGIWTPPLKVHWRDEVGQLIQNFNYMNYRLRKTTEKVTESNEKLKNFVAIAAHDLRSPLTTIHSLSECINEELKQGQSSIIYEMNQRISRISNRMLGFIDNLLTYSRTDNPTLNKEWVNLKEVIELIKEDLESSFAKTGGHLSHGDLPEIYADRQHITEIMRNLIENALKYRRPDLPPKIHISAVIAGDDQNNRFWEIRVKDNGIGIANDQLECVFIPYKRAKTSEVQSGFGLGLAVCHRLVKAHSGEIKVASEENEGSVFSFRIPYIAV